MLKGTYAHPFIFTRLLQILHIKICGTILKWRVTKLEKKKEKKVVGGFLAQPLSQRKVNAALGQIYGGYLWLSRNEPMGLNYWTQRLVSFQVKQQRGDDSVTLTQLLSRGLAA